MATVWIWVIVLMAIGIVGTALWFSPVFFQLDFHHHQDEDEGQIECRALGRLVHIRRRLAGIEIEQTPEGPALKVHGDPGQEEKSGADQGHAALTMQEIWSLARRLKRWLALMRQAQPILRRLARHMFLEQFHLRVDVGTGEAVSTGVLCGAVWSTSYTLAGWICSRAGRATKPDIRVSPVYQGHSWGVDVRCIVRVRLGHAIVTAYHLMRLKRRAKHGTPDSRVNEYRHVEYP